MLLVLVVVAQLPGRQQSRQWMILVVVAGFMMSVLVLFSS